MKEGLSMNIDLSVVLSVTTGRLLSNTHVDGLYKILNHMTNDNLYTHVLPRASEACKPEILRQHPALAEIVIADDYKFADAAACVKYVDDLRDKYGSELDIEPLPDGTWESKDPISELALMLNKKEKTTE